SAWSSRLVPPTATTLGEKAGYSGSAEPESPVLATKVTPGVVSTLSYCASAWARTAEPSAKPQLIDTTDTPGKWAAAATPGIRSARDWLFAPPSTILAPGAMAWVHSTSRASSRSQLATPLPVGSVPGSGAAWPCWLTTVRNADAGPYCASGA